MISRKMFAGAAILVLAAASAYLCIEKKEETVCFGGKCFTVEVAENNEDRARGLMLRQHLDEDKGMLFIFQKEGIYPFWMKNTLIPLDIIWMNEEKEVVYIKHNAEPCRTEDCLLYDPQKKALYVLELNAGTANKTGIDIGDSASF